MQTKKGSFQESFINTVIGFLVNLFFTPLVYGICGVELGSGQMVSVTLIFTVISVARSFVIRRFYNGIITRKFQNKKE